MPSLSIDLESRSAVDLRRTGVGVYAQDPSTDIWCVCYAVDDGPVQTWFPGEDIPQAILFAAHGGWPIRAYNAQFEKTVWRYVLWPRYGWPMLLPSQWHCTMAQALAMGLPASLDAAASALRLPATKDKTGYSLMMRMARPRKTNEDGTHVWWDEPERLARLAAYCQQDVTVEREVHKKLLKLSAAEQELWQLDSKINERGLPIDLELCQRAKAVVEYTAARFDSEMGALTEGKVISCSTVAQLTEFCRKQGVEVASLDKAHVARLLAKDDLPDKVRAILELRQQAAKTSVAKIDAMLDRVEPDGRVRYLFQYHGASTGRWSGRGVQPQNLPRPAHSDVDGIIHNILVLSPEGVHSRYESPLAAVSDCLRGMIAAAPGNKLIAADFAAIESRVLAWLAGEEWKLEAFRNFDAGIGPDMYKLAYGKAFDIEPEVITKEDPRRLIGKVMDLACGFGGGAAAFHKMALSYGADVGDNYDNLCYALSMEAVDKAKEAYLDRGKTSGMRKESWIAAELIKGRWRGTHPRIVAFWRDLEAASIQATEIPDTVVPCGRIRYVRKGDFLYCELPSKRILAYPWPKLVDKPLPWGGTRKALVYEGVNSYTRKWEECSSYGGLLAENVTQATARDLLAEAIQRLDKAGYSVVSHAHDEAVAEVAKDFGSVAEFCQIMTTVPSWASGCPIAAAGWEGRRYRK